MTEPSAIFRIGDVAVWRLDGVYMFAAGLQIDADGAPQAYHPPTPEHPRSGRPPGLDDLRNAGQPGHWWALATKDDAGGEPVIQGPDDPAPGFYVSTTALEDETRAQSDPRRYVDAATVPYISLPGGRFASLAGIGDLAMVFHGERSSAAIYADVGPHDHIGEGSIALATALGLFRGVNVGHDARDVVYVLLPGTHATPRWPREVGDIGTAARAQLETWGGVERVRAQFPYLIARTP